MHTVDAVLAAGGRPSVDTVVDTVVDPSPVAADGVDEVLTVWPRRLRQRDRHVVVPGPVEVSATDTGDRWLLEPGEPVPAVSHPDGTAGADDLVAGSAVDLYLRLWGRGGAGRRRHRGRSRRLAGRAAGPVSRPPRTRAF